jgi:hypothetical protein
LVDPAAHLAKMRANRGGVAVREEVEEGDEDE